MNLTSTYIYLMTQQETVAAWAKAEHYDNCEQKESFFYRLFHKS